MHSDLHRNIERLIDPAGIRMSTQAGWMNHEDGAQAPPERRADQSSILVPQERMMMTTYVFVGTSEMVKVWGSPSWWRVPRNA